MEGENFIKLPKDQAFVSISSETDLTFCAEYAESATHLRKIVEPEIFISLRQLVAAFARAASQFRVYGGLILVAHLPQTALAASAPPAYTVHAAMEYRLFDSAGKERRHIKVNTTVAIGPDAILIEPWNAEPTDAFPKPAFYTWGTSPVGTGEWIAGTSPASSAGLQNAPIEHIVLDNHPTRAGLDIFASLSRILYAPQPHPAFSGLSTNDWLFLDAHKAGYYFKDRDEIRYEITKSDIRGQSLVTQITAESPPYYGKQEFQGTPRRKLWTLSIAEHREWNGIWMPERFQFTGFQNVSKRVQSDDATPIVIIDGIFMTATLGAQTDIMPRLLPNVQVQDVRPFDVLRQHAAYEAPAGLWPKEGTPDYKVMVATNLAALSAQRAILRSITRRQSEKSGLVVLITVIVLLGPAIVMLVRSRRSALNSSP